MFRSSLLLAFCATTLPLVLAQDEANTAIDFTGQIPNANAFSNANSGINCQYIGNTECRNDTPLNRFGTAFQAAGSWTVAFCQSDSDEDGLTNGEELGDPCCVWTPGANPQRTINLSHPGLASETNTGARCPSPSPTPSVSASVAAASPSATAAAASPSAAASTAASAAASVTPSPSISPVAATDSTTTGTGVGTGSTDDTTDDTTTTDTATDTDAETTTEAAATPDTDTEDSSDTDSESGDDDDDGSVCFPALATVTLEDGSNVAMRDLRVGDRVQVGAGRFSDVFMFSHKLSNVNYRFVTLKAAAGARTVSLSLTKGHFVYANGKAVPASSVRVGDSLELTGEDESRRATVTEIKSEVLAGLYNPQTVDGNIVVNGVKATTFTQSVKHVTAHCMMMPVRAVFQFFGLQLTALEGGADVIADMLPSQV